MSPSQAPTMLFPPLGHAPRKRYPPPFFQGMARPGAVMAISGLRWQLQLARAGKLKPPRTLPSRHALPSRRDPPAIYAVVALALLFLLHFFSTKSCERPAVFGCADRRRGLRLRSPRPDPVAGGAGPFRSWDSGRRRSLLVFLGSGSASSLSRSASSSFGSASSSFGSASSVSPHVIVLCCFLRRRPRGMGGYYVIFNGKHAGIYLSWHECSNTFWGLFTRNSNIMKRLLRHSRKKGEMPSHAGTLALPYDHAPSDAYVPLPPAGDHGKLSCWKKVFIASLVALVVGYCMKRGNNSPFECPC